MQSTYSTQLHNGFATLINNVLEYWLQWKTLKEWNKAATEHPGAYQ